MTKHLLCKDHLKAFRDYATNPLNDSIKYMTRVYVYKAKEDIIDRDIIYLKKNEECLVLIDSRSNVHGGYIYSGNLINDRKYPLAWIFTNLENLIKL